MGRRESVLFAARLWFTSIERTHMTPSSSTEPRLSKELMKKPQQRDSLQSFLREAPWAESPPCYPGRGFPAERPACNPPRTISIKIASSASIPRDKTSKTIDYDNRTTTSSALAEHQAEGPQSYESMLREHRGQSRHHYKQLNKQVTHKNKQTKQIKKIKQKTKKNKRINKHINKHINKRINKHTDKQPNKKVKRVNLHPHTSVLLYTESLKCTSGDWFAPRHASDSSNSSQTRMFHLQQQKHLL